jgi:energy-coupling factor transport system substrate-specific component
MAAWGGCGILGAALAVVRPRAGRFTLAAVCALAGVAFGALMNFSLMATYGGDLSLQRFLVLESRAVPFDAAHAISNATLALIAGPAMVRMLVRFRERFEWRAPAIVSVLLLALALASVLPVRAQAAASPGKAAIWLASVQNENGGWGSSPGSASSTATTAWVILGLESVGVNPLDVSKGGHSAVDYLRARVGDLGSPGDFARTILALEGAGLDPRSFGGENLVAALAKQRRDNGSYEGWPGSTAFAIIALRAAGATGSLPQSTSWLAKVQNGDGGWGDVPGSPSTADGTGAAIQAIPGTSAADHGMGYLRNAQRPSGGFALGGSGAVNSQSTAWAVQGMLAVGKDPASVQDEGKSALDYLAARQESDGHYQYSSSSDQTPIWVTGQVLTAVAGDSFPVPPVARESEPSQPSSSTESSGNMAPAEPAPPVPTEAESPSQGSTETTPPAAAGVAPSTKPPATGPGTGSIPVPPLGTSPEGEAAEPAPAQGSAAPPFEAGDNPGPDPWIPIGIGLGASALALGSVLFLGRRFSW